MISDECADKSEALTELNINLVELDDISQMDAVIVAVEHEEYKKFKPISFHKILKDNGYLMDVKSIYPVGFFSEKPFKHWRL